MRIYKAAGSGSFEVWIGTREQEAASFPEACWGRPAMVVRLMYCVRRRPDMTKEEFDRYWFEVHGPLVRQHMERIGMKGYIQHHTVELPFARTPGSPGELDEFDGIAEIWWESVEQMARARSTPPDPALANEIMEDERKFIDHSRSTAFYVDDRVIIGEMDLGR